MLRSLVKGFCAASVLSGCLDEGRPWGVVQLEGHLVWQPTSGRLEGGELKTSRDYRITFEGLKLEGELVLQTKAGTTLSFDPANPPNGYSSCHNGHCHTADGGLVDYADIEASLSGNASGPSWRQSFQAGLTHFGETSFHFSACQHTPCEQAEQLTWGLAKVHAHRVELSFAVRDSREPSRLGTQDGERYQVVLEDIDVTRVLEMGFGPDDAFSRQLTLTMALPESLWDRIDFASMDLSTWPELLAEGWKATQLQVDTDTCANCL